MRPFRFGFTLATHRSLAKLTETCRTAEAYGFDVAVAVDHLGPGRSSPFQVALAAAGVSERLQVGTYVLNAGFWNPSMLAREVSTAARFTGGRFELGLGAGVIKAEFDAAGIPFRPFAERMDWLAATIDTVGELIRAEPDLQRPPVLVGGTGLQAMALAGKQADIMSFAGIHHVVGSPPGTFRVADDTEADEQVASFRAAAGSRAEDVEFNNFLKVVELTGDRRAAAEAMAADQDASYLVTEPGLALRTPFLLFGTEDEMARQLLEHRERYGFSYLSVQRPHMPVLGPVIERVRRLAGERQAA